MLEEVKKYFAECYSCFETYWDFTEKYGGFSFSNSIERLHAVAFHEDSLIPENWQVHDMDIDGKPFRIAYPLPTTEVYDEFKNLPKLPDAISMIRNFTGFPTQIAITYETREAWVEYFYDNPFHSCGFFEESGLYLIWTLDLKSVVEDYESEGYKVVDADIESWVMDCEGVYELPEDYEVMPINVIKERLNVK